MLIEVYTILVPDYQSICPGGKNTFLFHTKFVLFLVKDVAVLIFRPKENVVYSWARHLLDAPTREHTKRHIIDIASW